MSLDEIVAQLEHDDSDHVVSVLLDLTEDDRKALGPKARGWLTRGNPTRVSSTHAALAVLATAKGWRQAMVGAEGLGWFHRGSVDHHAVAILQARDEAWLPDLVGGLLEAEGSWNWRLARELVRVGAVPAPDHPEYFRGTVRGASDGILREPRLSLVEQLDADPGLVGDHLLRMLATEGTGRLLAYHDTFEESTHEHRPDHTPFPAGTWRVALLTLAQQGRLDRGRLLDTVLAAPLRDWASADLSWFVGMHDALEPTLDEVLERQGTYVRLLTVEHGPSVKTAQRQLLRLVPDRLETEPFLAASRATLGRTDRASVAAHLRLLDKLAKADPDLDIADTVRVAEDHPRADVRELAATILRGIGAEVAPEPGPPRFAPVPPEPRPAAPPVEPISSADELAEVLLGLHEEIDPLEMERAIDGLLRLADERPLTWELLEKRASEATYYDDDPRIAARVLTLAWLTPRRRVRDGEWPVVLGHTIYPPQSAAPQSLVGALGRRLTAVAHAVRQGPHASVSLPSRADFTLDADELVRRLRRADRAHPVLELELVVALLRVPGEDRAAVEVPRSLRGSTAVARAREGRAPHWAREVVSNERQRWDSTREVVVFRDERGREGDAAAGILARSAPGRTVGREVDYGAYESPFEQTLGLGAALLPHDHDVLAAHAHPYLHRDLSRDRACSVPVVDAIARARTPNGTPASSALVLALAAKDARGRTAAQDAILDLARHGVLDGVALGRQAALLMGDDVVVGQRVSGALADCARASDAAVPPVLDALQEIVTALPGRRDAGPFLELTADLAERTGRTVDLPAELRALAEGKASSVVAKATRRLHR